MAINTKYYWKVVATDPSGSATSKVMNFTYMGTAWSYQYTDGKFLTETVSTSANGEYIIAGSSEGEAFLFKKDSGIPSRKLHIAQRFML